jgi:signal transduction histidine kinase
VAGVLTLVNVDSSPRFTESDVQLAEDLCLRAAHAIDNARLYQQALEANRTKDEFLATLSHELRTPLTSILGWANLLRMSNFEESTLHTAAETIERSAKMQAALIDDLLDVSRIVTGKFTLNVTLVDAVQAVASGVAASRPAAEAKGITVTVTAPESLELRADANRLQQIVWNLMSNAVKFSGEGRRIDVIVSEAGDYVVLQVRDEGIGIAADQLPRVFDRFWQADSSSHRVHAGLGLGLAIVKYLAEMHGGAASVESDGPGKGATFSVRLPAGRSADHSKMRSNSLFTTR